MQELLRMEGITKTFPGVKALDNVTFTLKAGEVHALLGENGAGKSTLMKVLNGVHGYRPDSGKIFVRNQETTIDSVNDAHRLGIAIIYQEMNLCPDLSVADNVFIGRQKSRFGFVDNRHVLQETQKMLDRLGMDTFKPTDLVRNMSVAQTQMVEICKALSYDTDILVFDEPTAALAEKEIVTLFKIIHELKAQGKGIIYISHRMEELSQIADRVTVLRDGCTIGESFDFNSTSMDEIIRRMVGRTIEDKYPKHVRTIGEKFFEVNNLKNKRCDIKHFDLRRGEIHGIAGLMGAGRTEMVRSIVGADPSEHIELTLEGKRIQIRSPKQAMDQGVAYLTEDRKHEGLALNMDCEKNINMSSMKKISHRGFVSERIAKRNAEEYVKKLAIKTPKLTQYARLLSGGNQQKIVIAKWLSHGAKVMIFDEPTRGIDVGAKYEIYKLMNELSDAGVGIIMISSELPELLGMSDRISLMHEGQIVGELDIGDATQEKVLGYIAGIHAENGFEEEKVNASN